MGGVTVFLEQKWNKNGQKNGGGSTVFGQKSNNFLLKRKKL